MKRKDDSKALVTLISYLDGYRDFRFQDVKRVDKLVKDIRLVGISKDWKHVRRDVDVILKIIRSSKIRRYARIFSISQILALGALGAITGAFLAAWQFNVTWLLDPIIQYPALITLAVVIIPNFFFISRWYVKERIRGLREEKKGKFKRKLARVKGVTQGLIWRLGELVKRSRDDPKRYRLVLYHGDYQGIEITGKPSILSGKYKAIPLVGKGGNKK